MNEREIANAAVMQCRVGEAPSIEAFEQHVRRLFVKPEGEIGKLTHAAMGVATEAGELLDAVKKTWIYGKPLDRNNLLEESGDALFYIVALLNTAGFTLEEAMAHNMIKLGIRFPDGYTDAAARERADKQESNINDNGDQHA